MAQDGLSDDLRLSAEAARRWSGRKTIVATAIEAGQGNRAVRAALRCWTRSPAYLAGLAADGAQRHGLDGAEVEAVSAEHQAEALRLIEARREATRRETP